MPEVPEVKTFRNILKPKLTPCQHSTFTESKPLWKLHGQFHPLVAPLKYRYLIKIRNILMNIVCMKRSLIKRSP